VTLLWAGAIAAGSLLGSVPPADRILPVSHADLILHVLLYGTLAPLIASLLRPGTRRLATAAGVAFAFGLLLECLQPLTGRAFALLDVGANAVGALLGAAAAAVLLRRGMPPTDAGPPN
jgi:VanZ family protein